MATSGVATITAGNTFVVVDHTYGSIPLAVNWEALSALGGRDVWISDKTATQFTINISMADPLDSFDFSWAIIEKGDTGPQGPQGIQGIQGETGAQGQQGIQGIQGETGAQGQQGVQGEQGLKGDKGDAGEQGIQGVKGDAGEQGIQGIQGIQGEVGSQGAKGDTGEQGIQGEVGPQGPAGANGAAGTLWYVSASAPDVGEGVDGDFHFVSSTGGLYRKVAGAWSLLVTLPLVGGGGYETEYCAASDVRLIVNTSLTDANLETLIALAGQEIVDRKLTALNAYTVKRINLLLAAELVALRDPQSKSIGEYAESKRGPQDYRAAAENAISSALELVVRTA